MQLLIVAKRSGCNDQVKKCNMLRSPSSITKSPIFHLLQPMQRRPKVGTIPPQEQRKSGSATDVRDVRGEQLQQRSPVRSQANDIPLSLLSDAPPPSLVVPERLDSFICVVGNGDGDAMVMVLL